MLKLFYKLFSSINPRGHTMISARDAALYLMSLDNLGNYFNKDIIQLGIYSPYEGNVRLNKIIHLANNMYYARTEEPLIEDDFYAYVNGAVALDVQENYAYLLAKKNELSYNIGTFEKEFLKKVFDILKDTPIERLVEIDHEDPAWIEKSVYPLKLQQKMEQAKYLECYKDMYEAANFVIDRMEPVWV